MAGNRKSGDRKDAVKARYARILEESGAYERFHRILKQTVNDQNFLKAFEMAEDRASGRPQQGIDLNQKEDENKPTTDALIETLSAVRAELDNLRKGIGLETGK